LRDFVAISNRYVGDVVSGKIPACIYVRQACARQREDLLKEDFKYHFDPVAASRICKFIELLPHIKGKWAREGRLIELEPWQVFILSTVFGWVDGAGLRRFKVAYTEIPRKNAKSTISSGVALYLLAADGESGAEVYSAATTRDQARITWHDSKKMVDKSPGLRSRFGVQTSAHSIFVESESSSFKALSRDQGGNLDGLNVHGGIIDELHAHKTRDVFDVIETGTGARDQSLLWLITTAGFNRAGICYEQRSYLLKILSGAHIDEEYFGLVYTVDDGDDWTDEASWEKANPNWGKSVNPDDIRRKARKAMEMASAQNNFLTKHLNRWVNADTAWMDMRAWESCGDRGLDISEFYGRPCYLALDLASKTDIADLAILFPLDAGGYAEFHRHYLPEEAVENGRNSQYQGWEIDGYLTTTPGSTTDQATIEADVRMMAAQFDVKMVGYDPWQAHYLASRLSGDGLPMVEVRQTVANMSEPMKELEAMVLNDQWRHNQDPVQSWMLSNVVAHTDAKDNIYPRKEFPENKIDGVVATIMALGAAMKMEGPAANPYADRGLTIL